MQHIKGLSWHMPYAIFYNIRYAFSPSDCCFTIISNCQQIGAGISDAADQNKSAVSSSLVLYLRKKDTSPALKALPEPEDHKRDLLYCTFELQFTAMWTLHIAKIFPWAIRRHSVFSPEGWSAEDCYLQRSNICMWLAEPPTGDTVVLDGLQDCLVMPF